MLKKVPASVAEREEKLRQGLSEEITKKNINDSKFRAVAQHMDYNGFHQMVLGANLRPTKAGEVFSIVDNRKSNFNPEVKPERLPEAGQKGAQTLLVRWRKGSNEEKVQMLENTEEFYEELMKFNDFAVLAEVIAVCHGDLDLGIVRSAFEMLTRIPDFKGSKKLLTRKEKEQLAAVLSRLNDPNLTDFFENQ